MGRLQWDVAARYARATRIECTVIIQADFLLFLGDINVLWMPLCVYRTFRCLNEFVKAASELTHFSVLDRVEIRLIESFVLLMADLHWYSFSI